MHIREKIEEPCFQHIQKEWAGLVFTDYVNTSTCLILGGICQGTSLSSTIFSPIVVNKYLGGEPLKLCKYPVSA